ncbi:MAG: hypothetical protein ACYTXE_35035 [Nostoc sp.]
MKDKPRKQLSLRFDNYADLLDEATKYCETNNITLTYLVATGLRLVMTSQTASQVASHDKADNSHVGLANIEDRLAKVEEQLATTSQESAIAIDRQTIRDEIDNRTAYLATAMNEVKSQLENEIEFLKSELKQLKEENLLPTTGEKETLAQELTPTLPQEELVSAIAPKATEDNIVSALAGKKISSKKLKSIATSIQTTLKEDGIELSQTIIKEKVLEMYPNPDDWYPRSEAREDVIKALEKEHRK